MDDARAYGQHLASMLAASHFSVAEKQAWAVLIPDMSLEQLKKFDAVLRADMTAQSTHELEDLNIAITAARHQRDLSMAALETEADQIMAEVQATLEANG